MSRFAKLKRARVSTFVPGEPTLQVLLTITGDQVRALSPMVQGTQEMWLDDALMGILLAVAAGAPSQLMLERESHMNLLREYTERIQTIFDQKIEQAKSEAKNEISIHLLERGIIE